MESVAKPRTIKIHPSREAPVVADSDSEIPWIVLVVDDERSVHDVTRNVLKRFNYEGRKLHLLHAHSCEHAKILYLKYQDIAVALVDCMMEKNTSGLDFIKFVREEQQDKKVQLVLRTGQPNFAPEYQVLVEYDINDYLAKSELTSAKLQHKMITYLRSYESLVSIESQVNRLKKLDQLKDDFLSMITHELRNPSCAIEGLLSLLELEDHELSEKTVQRLKMMEAANKRMSYLIKDLTDTTMIRKNNFRLNRESSCIYRLLEKIAPLLSLQFEYSGKQHTISFINNVSDCLPLVELDEQRITQVFVNLINNALKFTKQGNITITSLLVESFIHISVTDTGIGIADENKERIFNRFERLDEEGDENREGLGLGLSIVKKIIEAHGGLITVNSQVGEGSTFTFTLPVENWQR